MKRPASLVLGFALLAFPAGGAPVVPPAPKEFVTDHAGVLSPGTRSSLESRLRDFEAQTSNQFLVYIDRRIPDGTTLEEFTVAVARAWRAGDKARNNGLVLFVFPESRVARFEVGYGLEGALPDALAGRILRDEAIPRFRAGDWDGGVRSAVDGAIAATKGEYVATHPRTRASREGGGIPLWVVLLILFVALPVVFGGLRAGNGRSRYWYIGGGGF
ncbi:MAG: TPM domain-containing protein, partial [Thermoanaerobaculia bacterium]